MPGDWQGKAFKLIHRLVENAADSNAPAEGPSGRLEFQTNFVALPSPFLSCSPFPLYDNPLILPVYLKLLSDFFFPESSEQLLLFIIDSEFYFFLKKVLC